LLTKLLTGAVSATISTAVFMDISPVLISRDGGGAFDVFP
jgi:hypothetical protein